MFSNAIKFMDRMYIGANGCDRATAFTSGYLSPIPHLLSQNLGPKLKCSMYKYDARSDCLLSMSKLSATSCCTIRDSDIWCKRDEEMEWTAF